MGSSSGTVSAVTEMAPWGIPRRTGRENIGREALKVRLEQPAARYPPEAAYILP